MILIITHKTDFTSDFVVDKLNKKNEPYLRFNCEDILSYNFRISYENGLLNKSFFNQSGFKSVWFRRTKFPIFHDDLSPEEKIYLINETDALMKNLFGLLGNSKWLSNPTAVYGAENKLMQLKIAQEIGFTIPDTLVTNSKDDIRHFYYQNKGRIIVKPISQTRLRHRQSTSFFFTSLVSDEIISSLNDLDLTPCIFQAEVEKEYEIRITVVGEKIFSAVVYSQKIEETKIDWRRKKLNFYEINLPETINLYCVNLVKALGLQFGAIDMIKSKSGEYVFLEINPNGQWAWIESDTKMNISGAIIDFLTN